MKKNLKEMSKDVYIITDENIEFSLIVMNFVPDTISPISLLELGRYATSGKMHVVCPQGYFRKGNVEVICDRDKIPLYESLDQLKESL